MSESSYQKMLSERERHIEQVRAFEQLARRNPKAYASRVRWFARLGYAFVFGLIGFSVVLFLATLWLMIAFKSAALIKLALVVGGVAYFLIRSLFVRIPPGRGVEIKRSDAPKLVDTVEDLRKQLKTPPIHGITVDESFNASAGQRPRFGLFGPTENTLTVGLPYMMAVSPDELRATVAHELGHFSGAHGKFGAAIYRQNVTWMRIWEDLGDGSASKILRAFLNWYMPRFAALTFVLRRANEYEADDAAVRTGGAKANASDLLRFEVQGRFVETEFWPALYSQVEQSEAPPASVMSSLSDSLAQRIETDKAAGWLREAFARKTDYEDTHPCLVDRLEAMGELQIPETDADWDMLANQFSEPAKPSAAEFFFGHELGTISVKVDKLWLDAVSGRWQERHHQSVAARAAIEHSASASEKADHLLELEGLETAVKYYEEALETEPDNAKANYFVGLWLAQNRDSKCEEHLLRAANSRTFAAESYGMLFRYFDGCDDADKAEFYYNAAERAEAASEALLAEVRAMGPASAIAPMKDEEARMTISHLAKSSSDVECAYGVILHSGSGVDVSIACFIVKVKHFSRESVSRKIERVMEHIEAGTKTDYYLVLGPGDKALRKTLDRVSGAMIFNRSLQAAGSPPPVEASVVERSEP